MRDICTKVDAPSSLGGINFVYFVYEMELRKLSQPFCYPHYYLYLFVHGEGEIRSADRTVAVRPGTLVLVHPWQLFRIVETKGELTYLYISFSGEGADSVLHTLGGEAPITAFEGYGHLIDPWMKAIRRVGERNALYVTEAVFANTLSYLVAPEEEEGNFSEIERYVQEHLSNHELSLRAVASIFFYSEKYFSALFREKTGTRFTEYLNDLRIRHAMRLMDEGVRSVAELSDACGFLSATYFSKVFRRIVGSTPAAYMKSRAKKSEGGHA